MKALKNLLNDLSAVGDDHSEVEDTDVREQMYAAVFHGFIEQTPGFELPGFFGMFEDEGNERVKASLARFVADAIPEAKKLGFSSPSQRFAAFENGSITSDSGQPFDDFFGSASTYEGAKAAFAG